MQRTNERVVYMNGEIMPESSAVVSFRDRSFASTLVDNPKLSEFWASAGR